MDLKSFPESEWRGLINAAAERGDYDAYADLVRQAHMNRLLAVADADY